MQKLRIALTGKPNSGKSSLFNQLTGLRQKIGNFPGVTVDKKIGRCRLGNAAKADIIDLPGIYSLYPRSTDEKIVVNILLNKKNDCFPDIVLFVADATNLQSSLLLLSQLIDLNFPIVLALNMTDMATRSDQTIDSEALATLLDIPVVPISARGGEGIEQLKKNLTVPPALSAKKIYQPDRATIPATALIKNHFNLPLTYEACQYLQQFQNLDFLSKEDKKYITEIAIQSKLDADLSQGKETLFRYRFIQKLLGKIVRNKTAAEQKPPSYRVDKILTHKVWGYLIFFFVLLSIFQSIFTWAQVPMDWIDRSFSDLAIFLDNRFNGGPFIDFVTRGILPGIGGVVIFVPQIAILFLFITILEETGYMSRIIFLMDKVMRKFGMSGKSVVPLISGWACAIPAIMATRNIENWKARLITLFVTPLMSCSARLPVYTILIALIVPGEIWIGFFNLQGLILMGLYMLGFFAAIASAWVMKMILKEKEKNLLLAELPPYRMPKWSHVGLVIVEKTKTFVFKAGKVILAISIVLWLLASYGPPGQMEKAEAAVYAELQQGLIKEDKVESQLRAYRLEHSYAGIMGKSIEPIIAPLGYDWKIGIALVASFAAREVFVATIATIYSIGGTENETTIKNRLKEEKNLHTGGPRFTYATILSLLVFYTFAMQCMSTLAVVKRETKGWKWPVIQLAYMTALAYISAFVVYRIFV